MRTINKLGLKDIHTRARFLLYTRVTSQVYTSVMSQNNNRDIGTILSRYREAIQDGARKEVTRAKN